MPSKRNATAKAKKTARRKADATAKNARAKTRGVNDPRLVSARILTTDEEGLKAGDLMIALSPVRLDDGSLMAYYPPQPVAFNLLEAKRHRDRAVPRRLSILGNLRAPDDDGYRRPVNPTAVIDCLSDLVGAVLHAFTAIESAANHSIDQLDDDATVTVTRAGTETTIEKSEMVRRLNITEKFELAVPLLDDGHPTKGTAPWERFVHLKRLRDDLVHVKERGYSTDPDKPSAYGKLMLGHGDACVEEAAALVAAARPALLVDNVRAALAA